MNIIISSTKNGLMLMVPSQSGFSTVPFFLPAQWGELPEGEWLKGFPINIEVTPVGSKFVAYLGKHGSDHKEKLFEGSEAQANEVKAALQKLWMAQNGIDLPVEQHQAPAPSVSAAPANATPVPSTHQAVAQTAATGNSKLKTITISCIAGIALLALGAAGFYATTRFMQGDSKAPSIDLSGMSIEQAAQIDQNPILLNSIQSNMIEAVKFGSDAAKNMSTDIGKEHMDLLASMGLEPGISMENATACLSNLYQ